MTSYYKTLELESSATQKEIKDAFRVLAKKYHPDTSRKKETVEKFREITEAYDVLSDEVTRKIYDEFLDEYEMSSEKGFGTQNIINIPETILKEHEFMKMKSISIFGDKNKYTYDTTGRIDKINISRLGINIIKKSFGIVSKKPIKIRFSEIEKIELGETSFLGIFHNQKQLIIITKNNVFGHSTNDVVLFKKYCDTLSFYIPWFNL
jgi:curved DNA-binding protein CbpA